MFLDLNTIQLIQASAFQGIALSHLTILSSGLLKIPNITLLRKSLKYFRLVCGTNCYLNVESDHFQGSTRLCHVEIEKAGLTDISWRLSIRKQVRVISVAYNNNATLDSIYGIRFDKLSYLNLNHNFIITINIFYLDMPKLSELKIEENQISHLDLVNCDFNGSALGIILFGNPLNCSAEWRWLHDSLIVMDERIHSKIECGNRKISFKKTGGRLNKKDGLTRYGDSHVKDKTS